MTKEVAVLLYPGCIFFEIALAVDTLAQHMPVRYFTPDGRDHVASNGAHIRADGDFRALARCSAAAVLVPGGDPGSIIVPERLATIPLQAQAQAGVLLAGICAGSLVLASAGLLNGRRGTHNYTAEYASAEQVDSTSELWKGMLFERADLVEDGQFITAQPWAYRAYAAAVARRVGVLSQDAAAQLEAYVAHRMHGGGRGL